MEKHTEDQVLVLRFRKALALVAGGMAGGLGLELASQRHWATTAQFAPWVVVVLLVIGAVVLLGAPTSPGPVLLARGLALVAALVAGVGMVLHINANLRVLGGTWSRVADVWSAASGGASYAPALVPGTLGLAGLLLALATLGVRR